VFGQAGNNPGEEFIGFQGFHKNRISGVFFMKKVFLVILSVSMVLVFSACQNPAADSEDNSDVPIGTVGYVSERLTDTFNAGFKPSNESSAIARNAVLISREETTQVLQAAAVRDLIEEDVSVIVVYPANDSKDDPGWEAVLAEAKAAGIGVIFIVSAPDEALDYTTLLVSNDYENGKLDADWLKEHVTGPQTILEISGPVDHPAAIARHAGFIANKPADWDMVEPVYGGWDPENSKTVTAAWLAANPGTPVDIVFAHNDGIALGAIEALQEAELTVGTGAGEIRVVSVDAVEAALISVAAGELACTVYQGMPALGPVLFDAIQDYVNGTVLEKTMYTNSVCIDAGNLP